MTCKNCKNRSEGCHERCAEYVARQLVLEEERQQKYGQTHGDNLLKQHKLDYFKRDSKGRVKWKSR